VVSGAKSGEGASAVAVNLAAHFAGAGARSVAIIDGDARFGDVALMLGMAPPELSDQGLEGTAIGRQEVLKLLTPHESTGLMVLSPPRSTAPISAEIEEHTLEVVSTIQALVDIVVLDAPFRLVEAANLLTYADELVMVTDGDIASLKNTLVACRILSRAGRRAANIRLVVNRVRDVNPPDVKAIERLIGADVAALLPKAAEVRESLDTGDPLVSSAPTSAWSQAIAGLASSLDL
jgi:pilus assembly protein CpaE